MINQMKRQSEQNQSESVESSGKTLQDAIDSGLRKLGLAQDEVQVKVLKQGSRGILGLGAEDAVVLLTPNLQPIDEPSVTGSEAALSAEPQEQESEKPVVPAVEVEKPEADSVEVETDVQERARVILQTLLEKMSVTANVSARMGYNLVDEGERAPLTLDITGPDLGLLIGRRGETLRALQFVTRQILNKEAGYWVPVVVDVESYLVRRRKTLQQLATRMADRVIFSGRKVVLEPMPSQERRIIHLQLRDHDQVYTSSTGEGDRRKVVILPK